MNRLTELIDKKNTKKTNMANDINITPQLLAYYEKNWDKIMVRIGTLLKIADYFDISTDFLFNKLSWEDEEKYQKIKKISGERKKMVMDLVNKIETDESEYLEKLKDFSEEQKTTIMRILDNISVDEQNCFDKIKILPEKQKEAIITLVNVLHDSARTLSCNKEAIREEIKKEAQEDCP